MPDLSVVKEVNHIDHTKNCCEPCRFMLEEIHNFITEIKPAIEHGKELLNSVSVDQVQKMSPIMRMLTSSMGIGK